MCSAFDDGRPSLCLHSLSSLDGVDVVPDLTPNMAAALRGPFPGGASTWKGGFAYEAYTARAARPAAQLTTPPRPLHEQLRVPAEDLDSLLTDPRYAMPRADLVPVVAAQDQEVLEALQIDWRALDVARGAGGRPPHAGAALEPMPFINRPAVTTAPLLHVREPWTPPEAPLRFRDMLLDGRRVKHMTDYLDRLHTSLLRGSRLRKPFVLREEELKQQYRGRPWDISNLNAVVPLDDSDVDESRCDMAAIESLLPDYDDQRTLWSLRFGLPTPLDDEMPIAIILSPPNLSAMPHLARLAAMDDAALDARWATEHAGVPQFPFSAHPYGMDVRYTDEKIKYREISDYSGPHLPGGDDSLAVNAHSEPDDTHLTSIRMLMRAAAVVRSASSLMPDDNGVLTPTAVAIDAVAMYRQFLTRKRDRAWQGKVALDANRVLRILRSEVAEFGGNWLPRCASGIAAAVDRITRILFWQWDDQMCELARTDPSAFLAQRLCPPAYRQWKEERRSPILGQAEQQSAHYSEAYLDDELAFLLGPLRAVMFLLIYCRVLRIFGMEPSLGKLKLGDGLTMLGADFFLREGVCLPSQQKLDLYEAWTSRIAGLARSGPSVITDRELESFNGSLNFGAFAIADAKIHLQHFFKISAAKMSPSLRRKGLRRLHAASASHAEALRDLFRVTGGLAFLEDTTKSHTLTPIYEGLTDANHTFSDFCGMGGVVPEMQMWWHFEFKDQEVLRLLKVHVLEMLADVVNVALVATLAPGGRYRGMIDNQSAMFGIRAQTAADPKLFELLQARHSICRRGGLTVELSEYVDTKANTSDPISRGKFEEFLRRAEAELGTRELTHIDLEKSPLATEVHALIDHVCNLARLLV